MGTQLFNRKQIADGGSPPYLQEVESLIAQAHQQKDRGQRIKGFEDALSLLQGAIAGNQHSLGDYLALAELHWELTKPQESINYLKEALQLAPKDPRPYALLGRYLLNKGLRDQAMNFLDRALQLDPDDAATRKLRDRAALQQKKNYTVVVNAKDLAAQPSPEKPAGQAAQKKAEATRLLNLNDLKGAAAALEEAHSGINHEVDRALAGLLGASMVGADVSILAENAKAKKTGGIVRALFAMLIIAMVGLTLGVAYRAWRPASTGGPLAELQAQVRSDQTSELMKALPHSEELGNQAADLGALAHALLVAEHGKDKSHFEAAIAILETAPAGKTKTPEALLARTLLLKVPGADADGDLDPDLSEAAEEKALQRNPYLLMARAERAQQLGAGDAAATLLHQAALAEEVHPRAVLQLALLYAERQQYDAALRYLERIWQTHPHHGPSLAAAVPVAHLAAYRDRLPGDGELAATATEKKVHEVVFSDETDPLDAALPAAVLAAFAQARRDDEDRDRLLNIAVGSSESGPVVGNPGLLEAVSMLSILEFDPEGALDLLGEHQDLVDQNVALQRNNTRASVLEGIRKKAPKQLRQIKLSSTRHQLTPHALLLPAGRIELTPARRAIPLTPSYDPRYFPESAIQVALELKDISPIVAKKKLETVTQVKLAQIALARGNAAEAMDYLNDVRSSSEGDTEFHLMEALIHAAQDKRSKARSAIEDAVALDPDRPNVLVAAARIQLSAGDPESALKSLKRLKREGYESPAAYSIEARALVQKGDFDGARDVIAKGRAYSEDDVDLLGALIAVECDANRLKQAQRAAARMWRTSEDGARALATTDPLVAAFVYDATADAGLQQEAVDALNDLVVARPALTPAHYFLGSLLLDNKDDKDQAVDSLRTAAEQTGCGAQEARARLDELGEDYEAPPEDKDEAAADKPTKKKKKRGKKRRRRRR